MKQTFEYDKIFYQEVIYWLQQKWSRQLNETEVAVLLEGYKFGRLTEMENEIRILDSEPLPKYI